MTLVADFLRWRIKFRLVPSCDRTSDQTGFILRRDVSSYLNGRLQRNPAYSQSDCGSSQRKGGEIKLQIKTLTSRTRSNIKSSACDGCWVGAFAQVKHSLQHKIQSDFHEPFKHLYSVTTTIATAVKEKAEK